MLTVEVDDVGTVDPEDKRDHGPGDSCRRCTRRSNRRCQRGRSSALLKVRSWSSTVTNPGMRNATMMMRRCRCSGSRRDCRDHVAAYIDSPPWRIGALPIPTDWDAYDTRKAQEAARAERRRRRAYGFATCVRLASLTLVAALWSLGDRRPSGQALVALVLPQSSAASQGSSARDQSAHASNVQFLVRDAAIRPMRL